MKHCLSCLIHYLHKEFGKRRLSLGFQLNLFLNFLCWIHKERKRRKNKQKLLVENCGLLVKIREEKEAVVTILSVQARFVL